MKGSSSDSSGIESDDSEFERRMRKAKRNKALKKRLSTKIQNYSSSDEEDKTEESEWSMTERSHSHSPSKRHNKQNSAHDRAQNIFRPQLAPECTFLLFCRFPQSKQTFSSSWAIYDVYETFPSGH